MNASAATKSRSACLLQLSAVGLVVGALLACNAVLGIGEAELICAESGCGDAGVFPGAAPDDEVEPGRVPPGRAAAVDAGPQDGSLIPTNATSGSPGMSELPVGSNATPPGGGGGVDSDGSASGNDNGGSGSSGSGDDANTGGAASGDEDIEPPPPPSPCQGRAPGEVFCSGTTRISCGSGGSVTQSLTCVSAEHCQQATGEACAVCLASEVRCDDDVLVSCNAARTGFDTQRCPSAALCDAATNRCGVAACSAGQSRCRGARLERCNAAQTGFDSVTECSSTQACNAAAGACEVCSPGTRRCGDGATIAICDASGQSEAFVSCGPLDGCVGGACVPLGLPLL